MDFVKATFLRRGSSVLVPIPSTSTADLVAQKISRVSRDDPDKILEYTWTDQ